MSKRPVSTKNRVHFFILLSHSFTWNWQIKMASFVTNFWQKSWNFWAVSWNRDIGIKCWNCQFGRKKIETGGTRLRRGRQFQFFPAKLTVSTFMPNHGFMKLPKNSTFCQKWSQKLPFLLSVSSETGDKKKEPGFHVKTGYKKKTARFPC